MRERIRVATLLFLDLRFLDPVGVALGLFVLRQRFHDAPEVGGRVLEECLGNTVAAVLPAHVRFEDTPQVLPP